MGEKRKKKSQTTTKMRLRNYVIGKFYRFFYGSSRIDWRNPFCLASQDEEIQLHEIAKFGSIFAFAGTINYPGEVAPVALSIFPWRGLLGILIASEAPTHVRL
jgi:hypothetical protein